MKDEVIFIDGKQVSKDLAKYANEMFEILKNELVIEALNTKFNMLQKIDLRKARKFRMLKHKIERLNHNLLLDKTPEKEYPIEEMEAPKGMVLVGDCRYLPMAKFNDRWSFSLPKQTLYLQTLKQTKRLLLDTELSGIHPNEVKIAKFYEV